MEGYKMSQYYTYEVKILKNDSFWFGSRFNSQEDVKTYVDYLTSVNNDITCEVYRITNYHPVRELINIDEI